MVDKSSLRSVISSEMRQRLDATPHKSGDASAVPDTAELTAALMSSEGDNEGLTIEEGREMLRKANDYKFRLSPSASS